MFSFLRCLSNISCCSDKVFFLNQDIDVGKAVRPQLAMRVSNASTAWKKVFVLDWVVQYYIIIPFCFMWNKYLSFQLSKFFRNLEIIITSEKPTMEAKHCVHVWIMCLNSLSTGGFQVYITLCNKIWMTKFSEGRADFLRCSLFALICNQYSLLVNDLGWSRILHLSSRNFRWWFFIYYFLEISNNVTYKKRTNTLLFAVRNHLMKLGVSCKLFLPSDLV